jgi:hypothetical protein
MRPANARTATPARSRREEYLLSGKADIGFSWDSVGFEREYWGNTLDDERTPS